MPDTDATSRGYTTTSIRMIDLLVEIRDSLAQIETNTRK